ncbi:unnamed protein product [Candida verbasci]|uniref:Nucleoporin n=1 Tax=Candida verbasci TaxID=1227364 RepID=A0A9W4TTV0_9ASCO|nr:unnamed protein product [Candida verbasci]
MVTLESNKELYEKRRKQRRKSELKLIYNDNDLPLIPSNILDQATQRIFLSSIFILIQSWKLYDLILMKSEINGETQLTSLTNFTFLLKYSIIDGIFLWILQLLNIEYLRFTPFKTLIMTIMLVLSSFFLVSSVSLPLFSNIFIPFAKLISQNKELNLIGEKIDRSKVLDMDSHFKGQLIIHFLPDSSTRMNPFHFDQTCLGINNNHEIKMPIEFNTTTSIGALQIQHTTPDNEIHMIDYSGYTLSKLFKKDYSHLSEYKEYQSKKDSRVFYVEFPITKPGKYNIKKVLDNKGNSIKVYKSEFLIHNCPTAKFYYPPNFNSNQYMCMSNLNHADTFPVPWLETYSTSIASVKINVKINGKDFRILELPIGQEYESKSNDLNYLKAVKLIRNSLENEILKSPQSCKTSSNSVLEFELLEIKDSFGMIHKYQPLSKDADVYFRLQLRKSATIGLVDNYAHQEMLVGGEKILSFTNNGFKDDDYPIEIKIEHNGQNVTKVFKNKVEFQHGITVKSPGNYKLISASDKYCPCEIKKSSVDVKLAQLPSLDIDPKPVIDKCLGTIGYSFNFNFTGKPPFKVQYHIYSNESGVLKPVYSDGRSSREVISNRHVHSFQFEPPHEGSYTIKFNTLKDANYHKSPIRLDEVKHSYSTYFKQASKIGIEARDTIHTCYGETANIPIWFQGSVPISFDYEFIDSETHKRLLKTVHVDNVTNYTISTPLKLIGKSYEIKLSNARDKFGCNAKIINQNKPVRIVSRSDIPEIEFSTTQEIIKLVEGSNVKIPLKLKSSTGFTRNDILNIKYQAPGSDKITEHRASLVDSSLKLTQEGNYWISAFENNGCKAKVTSNQSVQLVYYSRPTMRIITNNEMLQHKDDSTIHLNPICNGCSNEIEIELTGELPFILDYEIINPNGKIESNSMNIDKKRIKINLPTKSNGRYEHNFKKIFDGLHTRHNSKHVNSNVPKVIYDVNALPSAHFIIGKHKTQVCENKLNSETPIAEIPINLTGKAPFDISAVIKNENTGKVQNANFHNVRENKLVLEYSKFFTLGDYTLRFNKIQDSNGCINTHFKFNENYLISINEPPNIFKTDALKSHYCIGDHVSYNVSGVSPITIYYEYNNKLRKAETKGLFTRLASRPGILNIQGLSDSGENSCLVNYTNDIMKSKELSLTVHDIPSVEVNKGDYIIEDLHEGDQTELIFSFIGIPPFKLTYIRTIDIRQGNKKIRKLLEKHTIEDIYDLEYVVLASLEGIYEAIEIQDKYCRATKSVNYIE